MNNHNPTNKSLEFNNSQSSIPGSEAHNARGFQNFSQPPTCTPVNYTTPLPNQCIPPNAFFFPPPFYSAPPPFPHGNQNPTFHYPPPVLNFPPSDHNPFGQPFVSHNAIVKKNDYSNTCSIINEEVLFPDATKKPKITTSVKLWKVSRYFRRFYSLLKELECDLNTYNDSTCLNSDEDCRAYQSIISKQEKLISYKNSMTMDATFLCCLKFKINKRKKKRLYQKRIKKSQPSIHVYEVANMHVQQLQQEANRIKQEEKLKQEADNILSSVMQKKTDARYQIQLLTNLLKLHSARVHKLSMETKLTVDSSITGFEKILEKLKNLWESNLKDYITEENGLKLMIKELAVNAEDEDCMQLKRNFEKWLELMFGCNDSQSHQFYYNYDQLIEIRQTWDKFVVDKDDTRGSKIPAGWVLPKYNDNEAWKKFLFQ